MRKTLLAMALALGAAAAAAPAIAGEEWDAAAGGDYRIAPGEARLPAETIRKTLVDLGYQVDRVKLEDGYYEARAVNDSGIPIEVRYHPVTGGLVRARLKS